jgi:hypothetical protein
MRKTLAVFGLLAFAGVSQAAATTKLFDFRCTVNTSLRTCSSAIVFTTPGGSGGTDVIISIRNLQGAAPDQTGGSLITRLGLTAPPKATIGSASGLVVGTSGTVGQTGTPANPWSITQLGINGPIQFTASVNTGPLTNPTRNGGILGCNPSLLSPANFFQTCAALGQSGYVTFSFHTTGTWDAASSEIGIAYEGVVGIPFPVECRTEVGPTHPSYCPQVQVTPEPISMALLGTGLLGLGGAGLRRRRKGMDIQNG